MGSWGAGVYSDDYALDLRATISAVAKLPRSDDELLDLLRKAELCADDPEDEDHTTFWLVAADQLARRGCYPAEARRRALEIIASGADLKRMEDLGAPPGLLRKRQAKLAQLGQALEHPVARPRKAMRAPQPFTFKLGEVFVFPTSRGTPINPYFKSKALIPNWSHDGWGAAIIVQVGREFDYLAWCRVMTADTSWIAKPDMAQVWASRGWSMRSPGTCPPAHRQRLEAETVGELVIREADVARRLRHFRGLTVRTAAISDICISNDMGRPPRRGRGWPPWDADPLTARRLASIARPAKA